MAKYVIRYGLMRILGIFDALEKLRCERGMQVICRTDRGLEQGEVLGEANEEAIERFHGGHEGQILREITADDTREIARIQEDRESHLATCRRCIENLQLSMQLVEIEHIFGGERIIVYYLADGRVDFRELVRLLAGEFQTRIEMRQIGVRDEAKLMADFGDCGKEVCCNTHLVEMPPVSMKMAKLQKATLDPTKISGRCGRLKCCLRYEYDVYEHIQKELPSIGSHVQTSDGPARVLGQEILLGQLLVEDENRVRRLIDASEASVKKPTDPPEQEEEQPDSPSG